MDNGATMSMLTLPAALTLRDARSALATLGPAIAQADEATITVNKPATK